MVLPESLAVISLLTLVTSGAAVVRSPARLVGAVDDLLSDLGGSARRVTALLDDLSRVPGQVDALLQEVREVVSAAGRTVTLVTPIVERADTAVSDVGSTLAQAQQTADDVHALQQLVGRLVADLEPVLRVLAAFDPDVLARLPRVLDDTSVLLTGARGLPLDVVDDAATTVRLLPGVLEHLEDRVMPAVASLEGLVPVVDRLSAHVDNLNLVVADVGALLAGIPGSARLLKRGTPRPTGT